MIQTLVSGTRIQFFRTRENVNIEVVFNRKVEVVPYLVIYPQVIYTDDWALAQSYTVSPFASKGNSYFFELLNQETPRYFSLVNKEEGMAREVMSYYHFEPGDHLIIKVGHTDGRTGCQLDISGVGAAKYRCQYAFEKRIAQDTAKTRNQFTFSNNYNRNNRPARNRKMLLEVLEKFKPELSPYSYQLLKADVMCEADRKLVANFHERIAAALVNDDVQSYLRLSHDYRNKLKFGPVKKIGDLIQYASRAYAVFRVEKIVCDYLDKYMLINYLKIYQVILKMDDHDLRDKMIVILFMKYKTEIRGNFRSLMKRALADVTTEENLEILRSLPY